ncbi:NUDIX domain-containing protein [Acinetobacter puyangensis]|uniref:8-oxo-dGTP pyrophosphatase MutT, NUDIX family n=1 Tax=Acinetobacter puyangensis TaxID=1096779 RepID=A0A240E7Z5_9GAMM|nr:NUDIX domain-containing protein [Acinetobacter puyangensis]SNX44025.1 8-oxo-dGTP pyrophosphatase MutT, NUDIX family [Acinetobacter puyangensis]
MIRHKVCPIVLKKNQARLDILLFQHPNAGIQLVKGTPDPDEDLIQAAARELWEESGLKVNPDSLHYLGEKIFSIVNQQWHFYYCESNENRMQWSWQTIDDHGHTFDFFWSDLHNIHQKMKDWKMHPVFSDVLLYIQKHFKQGHK